MSSTLLSLGAALLGAAVLTTGVFLLISGQRRGRQVTGSLSLNHALLGGGFVAGGIAITIAAAHLWPASDAEGFDPNAILQAAPPAATRPVPTTATANRFVGRHWVLLAWGTPNDLDKGSTAEEESFSADLADMGRRTLSAHAADTGDIETHILSREQIEALATGRQSLAAYCSQTPDAVIVTVEVAGSVLETEGGGYVPWREPRYRLLDCRTEQATSLVGRVVERRGDGFPYEQALREDFDTTLQRWLSAEDEGRG